METPLPENGGIAYYLDQQLHVVDCRFSDNFPFLHERLYRQRLLDHPLSTQESDLLTHPKLFAAASERHLASLA